MQVTIEIEQEVVDNYVAEFIEHHDRIPSQSELQAFFDKSVYTVYNQIALLEGFIDTF